ncbi:MULTISPECIES: LLM class flavin-dependent oxidoreductase [Paraburkholderia]|uniref:LLM class flavin-dependent oxidoreductase n=1 Tax=Paraburkholderia podalyriae TaxID=1938811 RepID=A0ABR7PXQ4_9BURK|nr:LLM class flavin-dependent oxidoreductase [Paraburkholderia podalyriae]MBC8751051.1 LLM class flavin-dependent oxidoreductase [Paraburkholderia podalyriae]
MLGQNLRSGIFLAPYHTPNEDPTLALQRDLELVEHLDKLGFEEAWIGEHHSAGYEIISSPELFIAAAAERTTRIKLGTGVVSLPYHNPLMVANRIVQLDHMTRGRVMLGVGPGSLNSDAMMLGIEPGALRDRMAQSLDVIMRLLRGETVTETTDWFSLVEAKLHLRPFTCPHPEVAVASSVTPSGGRAAGKYGLGMLCVTATEGSGYDALATNWQVAQELAAENGHHVGLDRLRLVAPMHIAETREKAYENVRYGIQEFLAYNDVIFPARYRDLRGRDPVQALVESGRAVIGTPADAIAMIERLHRKQGDFGAFLHLATNWADFDATKRSYELYARYVVPHFRRSNTSRQSSFQWVSENWDKLDVLTMQARQAMFDKHSAEKVSREKALSNEN